MPGAKRPRKASPPPPPSHLNALAKAEWKRVAGVLAERGDLPPEGMAMVETYCVQFARWREAEAHVSAYGAVIPAPKTGVPMHNPMLAIANRAADMMLRLAKTLRLTPDTRPESTSDDAGEWDEGLLA